MMNLQRFAAVTGAFVEINNEIKALGTNLKAVDGTDGIKFDCKKYPNDRLMFIIMNNNASVAKDATIKAPATGGYAATDTDLTLSSIAAGAYAVAYVETARYANNDGTILIKGSSADIKAVGVVLGK